MRPQASTYFGGAAIVATVGVLAACGASTATGAGAHSSVGAAASAVPTHRDGQAVLLSSVQRTSSQSFEADLVMDLSMSTTGTTAGSFSPGDVQMNLHLDVQSEQLLKATMSANLAGRAVTAQAILAGSTLYTSSDGGKTWTSQPAPATNDAFGPGAALQFLNAVGTVVDQGAGTADGVSVERYQATLDPTKLAAASANLFSQLGGGTTAQAASQLLHSLTGDVSAAVDSSGRLVTENCTVDATMQLPGFGGTGSASTAFTLHESVQGDFHDYGKPVDVRPPAAADVRPGSAAVAGSSPSVSASISSSLPAPQ